jgi:hypothetical protein
MATRHSIKCQNTNTNDRIWLADLVKRLPNASSVYLHGFDISDAQFPPENPIIGPTGQNIPLSVHDALKPFPTEHNGRYDLVHIRLLTAGLKQGDYTIVLNNARNLLSKLPHHFSPYSQTYISRTRRLDPMGRSRQYNILHQQTPRAPSNNADA